MQKNVWVIEEETGRIIHTDFLSHRYPNHVFEKYAQEKSGLECSRVVRLGHEESSCVSL